MNRLRIRPLYGYGWEEDGKRIEVPAPFALDIKKIEGTIGEKSNWIVGTIVGSHIFAGKYARLVIRTSGAPSHYNVYIYEKSSLSDAQVSRGAFPVTAVATGFAELL